MKSSGFVEMKGIRNMERLTKYIFPLLVLGFLASLVFIFRTFLMSNIIEPIAIFLWAIWRIISSVDQKIYWMILIIICCLPVIRLFPPEKDAITHPAYRYRYNSSNRVIYWQTLIMDANLGKDEAEYFRDNLKKLLISAFADIKQPHPIDLEEFIASGMISLSPPARHFLFPPKVMDGLGFTSRLPDITSLLPRWLRKWVGKYFQQNTASIDEILEQIETEMELNHDR